jgi:hypothetical protein
MKIKSPFKDYYDYVSHIYGGGDERNTYLRNRIKPLLVLGSGELYEDGVSIETNLVSGLPYNIGAYENSKRIEFKWLVVCGKYYLLVGYKPEFGFTQFHILDEKLDNKFLEYIKTRKSKPWASNKIKNSYDDYMGVYSKTLIDISKTIKQPVFIINRVGYRDIQIESRIPNLGDLGFASIIKPEQLYQEIAYYISNIMVESVDIKPPVDLVDKDRIVQHGFDLKQSFRHRKD